jgi:hypothetical protein
MNNKLLILFIVLINLNYCNSTLFIKQNRYLQINHCNLNNTLHFITNKIKPFFIINGNIFIDPLYNY